MYILFYRPQVLLYTKGYSKMFDIMVVIADFCQVYGKLVGKIVSIAENHY